MIEELYINENYIELGKDTVIGITFQANDVGDIGNGRGDYSNIFKVPKTKNNQLALGLASELSSTTNTPYVNNLAKYLQNGIGVIPNGTATIMSFSDHYEIKITGGNVSPFELMKEKSIKDLIITVPNDPFYFSDNYFQAGNVGFIGIGVTTLQVGDEIAVLQDPGFVNASYNTNTLITSIIPNGGNNIIVTEIPWALSSPPNPGQITLFDTLTKVTWTLDSVVDSNNRTEGVIFPIINYNGMSTALREVDVRRLMPAVFGKTIMDYIFTSIGFTYTGNFKDEAFPDLLLPLHTDDANQDFLTRIEGNDPVTITYTPGFGGFPYYLFGQDVQVLDDKVNDTTNQWQRKDGLSIDYRHSTQQQAWQFVCDNNSVHNFDLSLPYTSTGTNPIFVTLAFKKSTSELGPPYNTLWSLPKVIAAPEIGRVEVAGGSSGTIAIEGSAIPQPGDAIVVTVSVSQGSSITFTSGAYLEINRQKTIGEVGFGGDFPVALNLPSLDQAKYVKTIAQIYGLAYQTDNYTKNVHFYSFKDIVKNIAIAKDWSDKLDAGTPVTVEYTVGDYAQVNVMSFKNDESVNENILLNSGNITVNNESLPVTKNLVELPFAESEMQTKLNGLDVPFINKFDVISDTFALATQPRLLYLDKQTLGVGISYQDGVNAPQVETDNIPLCYFVLAGKTYNLGWNNNLLENGYAELQNVLINVKKITGMFKLNAIDIAELDFSIPITLNVQTPDVKISENFYLNVVADHVAGRNTKCELIKL